MTRPDCRAAAATLCLMLAFPACDKGGSSGGPDPDAGDTETGDTESGPETWEGVAIASASAPDEHSVRVVFDGVAPAGLAGDPTSYQIDTAFGPTAVTAAEYDAEAGEALLTTERQRLGVDCTVSVIGETAGDGLEADFVAADTCSFWVADFSSATFQKYQIVADRVAVGSTCVVYRQHGMSADGATQAAAAFDNDIYPVLTDLFNDAPDQDGNGRITILGLDGQGYYGGYFDPTDTIPDQQSMEWWGIHSNAMEAVYINIEEGYFDVETVVPHEFQHLLYQERHGFTEIYWDYHNEGLAEAAVRIVNGYHPWSVDYYFGDYQGLIAGGLSLVHWNWGLYENYCLAYLFLNYVAGQLDGIDALGRIFDLPTGSPQEFDALLQQELGRGMNEVHLDQLIATWVRADEGVHSYNGMITNFPAGALPPRVSQGTTSVDLEPFTGTFFRLGVDEVDYPGTEGGHVVYAGIDSAKAVDLEAPFAVAGGALLVYNNYFEWQFWTPEHSGPDIAATGSYLTAAPAPGIDDARIAPAWLDPPPRNPWAPERFEAWRAAARTRVEAGRGR